MDEMPMVLVVEDLDWPKKMLERELSKKINFLMTSTIQEAHEKIKKEPGINLVVLNARIHGPISDSIEFAQELKESLPGLILVGTSNTPSYQDKLVRAGCDYATDHDSLVPALEHFLEL